MAEETLEIRRKRLYMRSIRRGIKEMDVILTAYAGRYLPEMDHGALDTYEALIAEQDLDIYPWLIGQAEPPERHKAMVQEIASKFNELHGASRTL